MLMQRYNHYSKQQNILSKRIIGRVTFCDPPIFARGVFNVQSILAPRTSHLVPRNYPHTLEYYTPMQLVVPSVVRIAVMMLASICKTVFQPSFFIATQFLMVNT